ncbi:MAG: M48 family metallopeptidase [Mesorhizobium sp.]|nr:M48 family metallopeptidase [Mesorhizobium sp.]
MASFDFRAQQDRSRRMSLVLVALFVVMVAVIAGILGTLASIFLVDDQNASLEEFRVVPELAIGISLVVMAVIFAIAFFKILSLGSDGARVAQSLGAEEVTEDTQNVFKKRYLNVIEEMSIAAGLPRPRAFVVKNEQGINAFAAGGSAEKAAIGVTHGALVKLNREELAGVVAHEMAHIANLDTRLNMRLMGMVFGLVALYTIGRVVLRSAALSRGGGGRDNRGAAPMLAIGIAMLVLGSLGVLGGRVLQSAVSRKREYLADATGVQFTRNPQGLANALKKIGATSAGSKVENGHVEEARHMFFAQATGSFVGLFSTHPPLDQRIRALDPQFDPKTDPIFAMDDKQILRETRHELVGPWG